jgi:N-glycosylase/DNA lyase
MSAAPLRWTLRPVAPYDFATAIRGHGWFDLPPHRWDPDGGVLETAAAVAGRAFDLRVSAAADGAPRVRVAAAERPVPAVLAQLRAACRRMLRVDVDLREFWAECGRHARLGWVPERRAGHLMQSPTLFEDLLKILFTTNCSWSLTRSMARNLVEALGPDAPSGRRAFPPAEVCAAQDEAFWRERVRVGYRARHCVSLARGFAEGRLRPADFEDPELPVEELRRRLLALPGFGPYAVGHALRGLGHYEDLALDSWCRGRMAELLGRRRPPADSWFEREYRRFGRFAGLALWMELTADWHA